MASSKIERVLRQALTTFSDDSRSPQVFRDNFTKLQQIAGQLDAQSVGFDTSLLQWNQYEWESPSERRRRRVPVTYIEIFENRHISVNVFVIRDGGGLPLHDHPSMHGLLKVIHGKIKIQSYTPRQKDCSRLSKINVTKLAPIIVTETDGPCVLYPLEGNIHQIDAIEGPAAFVDIIAPPYTICGKRRCRYFKEINTSKSVKLITAAAPEDYRSDSAKYTGPTFSLSS